MNDQPIIKLLRSTYTAEVSKIGEIPYQGAPSLTGVGLAPRGSVISLGAAARRPSRFPAVNARRLVINYARAHGLTLEQAERLVHPMLQRSPDGTITRVVPDHFEDGVPVYHLRPAK